MEQAYTAVSAGMIMKARTPEKPCAKKYFEFQDMMKLIYAIIEVSPKRGARGKIDCPVCGSGGSVVYARNLLDGHHHARCRACGIRYDE